MSIHRQKRFHLSQVTVPRNTLHPTHHRPLGIFLVFLMLAQQVGILGTSAGYSGAGAFANTTKHDYVYIQTNPVIDDSWLRTRVTEKNIILGTAPVAKPSIYTINAGTYQVSDGTWILPKKPTKNTSEQGTEFNSAPLVPVAQIPMSGFSTAPLVTPNGTPFASIGGYVSSSSSSALVNNGIISGDQSVSGNSMIAGNQTISGSLTVNGTTTLSNIVAQNAQIDALTLGGGSGTPTEILGRDASGSVNGVGVGSGLSLSGGVLSIVSAVLSVTTDGVSEGLTNLYFTDLRAQNALSGTITTLNTSLSGVTANISTLFGDLSTLSGGLATTTSNLSLLTSDVSTISGSLANTIANLSSLSGTLFTTNSNLSSLTSTVGTLSGNLATTNSNLSTLTTSLNSLSGVVAGNTSAIVLLTSDLSSVSGSLNSLTSMVGTLGTNLLTLSGTLFTTNSNLTSLSGVVSGISTLLTSTIGDVSTLSGLLSTTNTNLSSLTSTVGTLSGNLATTNGNLSSLSGVVSSVSTLLSSTISDLSTLSGSLAITNSNLLTLSGNLVTTNSNLSTLTTNFTTLSGTVATLLGASHDALTLVTTNGLSLVGQQLSLALVSTSTTGALSATDWNTFNNKINLTSLSAGSGITYNNTTGLFGWNGTTTDVAEGTNLYYTTSRFNTDFAARSTTNLSEGTNLYYTTTRANTDFDTRLTTKSTTDLTEGTNLYFTNARADARVTTLFSGLFDTRLATKTTTDVVEGINLYYTTARFNTDFTGRSTTNLTEGTNLYYTQARFDTAFGAKTTGNLTEGLTNLYFTDLRAQNALSGTIATLNTSLSGVTANISTLFGDLSTLSGGLVTTNANLALLSSDVSTISGSLASTIANLSTLSGTVALNTSAIATNASNIVTLTSNLATATGNIATLTTNLFIVSGSLAATNSSLSLLTTDFNTLSGVVAGNTSAIATNAGNITTLSGLLSTTNSNLAIATGNIFTLSGLLSTAITDITTLSGTVATLAGASHDTLTLSTTNGLSLVGQQLSLALASTSTTGALSATDWNTFNSKENTLTFNNGLSRVGNTIGLINGSNGQVLTMSGGVPTWLVPASAPVTSVFGRNGLVIAQTGDYATDQVTEGTNLYFTNARADARVTTLFSGLFDTRLATKTTTDVGEGTNLYYTTTRANTDFDTRFATRTTTNLTEGTNLYYTTSRFNTDFAARSTTNLTEGTNLYYTDARARAAFSITGPLTYSGTTGIFGINQANTSTNGFLSSVDWNTFNNKLGIISGTPNGLSIVGTGISLALASTSTTGALSAIDWNTFNGKENILTFNNGLSRVGNIVGIGTLTGGMLSGFTSGQLVFGSTTGGLTQSGGLFWNNTTGRLGVGTATPTQLLDVAGTLRSSRYLLDLDLSLIPIANNQSALTSWWGLQLVGNRQANVDYTPIAYGLQDDYGVLIPNQQATKVALMVRGAAGQSGHLTRWENSAGTTLSAINANGSLSLGTGASLATLHNAGSTLFESMVIANLAGGGAIGTAVTTVDIKTAFNINQTTANQTLALPAPTNTTAGRIVYINSIGTVGFTMIGERVEAGQSRQAIWNGTAWKWIGDQDGEMVQMITKSTTETVNAIAIQNDDQLAFSVNAGETWVFDIDLNVFNNNSATPDWKADILGAAGWTCDVTMSGIEPAGTAFPQVRTTDCDNAPTLMQNAAINASATSFNVTIQGTITATTAGTVQLRWAPITAANLTVLAGSKLEAYKIRGADLAEVYYTDDATLSEGHIVALAGNGISQVAKTKRAYDNKSLGIISTKPGMVIGDTDGSGRPVIVGLAGRVPVKVDNSNGDIVAGDYITTSSTPGIGMRATEAGRVIGKALTGLSGDSEGTVIVFIENTYYDGIDESDYQNTLMNASGSQVLDRFSYMVQKSLAKIHTIAPKTGTGETDRENLLTNIETFTSIISTMITTLGTVRSEIQTLSGTLDIFSGSLFSLSGRVGALESDTSTQVILEPSDSTGILSSFMRILEKLSVQIETVFKEMVTFVKSVTFQSDVIFEERVVFEDRDMAGTAIIIAGDNSVRVDFNRPYASIPVVTVSADAFVTYRVTDKGVTGFTIETQNNVSSDTQFDWMALMVTGSSVTSSTSSSGELVPVEPAPTETTPEEVIEEAPVEEVILPVVSETTEESTPDVTPEESATEEVTEDTMTEEVVEEVAIAQEVSTESTVPEDTPTESVPEALVEVSTVSGE